ncbi:hypothetical protein ILT44_28680, partial [Microvirga sp. BT689]|uniref:hypothetical protein n=1 Tax=Microvirga arvi TaxID=2778731 RepID=UPI001950D91F
QPDPAGQAQPDHSLTLNVRSNADYYNPSAADQAENRETLMRLNYALVGLVKGKRPRLERTLPAIDIESHRASLQIWSFGDQEVYLVGCLPFRERGRMYFDLQLRNSVDDIRHHMKLKLQQIRT